MILITINYRGQTGSCHVNVQPGTSAEIIKRLCENSVRAGKVPGVHPLLAKGAFANVSLEPLDGNQAHLKLGSRFLVEAIASQYWMLK
jgi:hypothetical protein